MSSIIIGNSTWNQRGLVLTRQDAQEQVNGLVTVQLEYVGPANKINQIARQFYTDAPPPIWPSVVNRSELLTNRLYMENRTVTMANGLMTVSANYVGGLVRNGFSGYYLRTTRETGITGVAVPQEGIVFFVSNGYIENVANPDLSAHYTFAGDFIRHTIEFVQIGEASAFAAPALTFRDMFVPQIARSRNVVSFPAALSNPNNIFSSYAIFLGGDSSFPVNGPIVKLGNYLSPKFVDRPSYVTPSIKVIQREYYF